MSEKPGGGEKRVSRTIRRNRKTRHRANVGQAIFNEVLFACYSDRLMAETIQQHQNRAMETGALWKPGKTKVPFFPVPTALGKLRPRASSFPQFPQPLRLVQIETKKANPKNKKAIAYPRYLTHQAHFRRPAPRSG
jgi:hypothetical protein